jgi:hypothetical protein
MRRRCIRTGRVIGSNGEQSLSQIRALCGAGADCFGVEKNGRVRKFAAEQGAP